MSAAPRIVKLGGSVLSARGRYCVFDGGAVERLTDVLAAHLGSVVVVHGTGSFGRAYLPLYDGARIAGEQGVLARTVQRGIRELHLRTIDQLVAAGLPVRSFDPESVFAADGGRIATASLEVVRDALEHGALPVVHGGTIPARGGDYEVLSSDHIVEYLARALGARTVVWCTDVDGVLDRERTLMPRLTAAERDRVLEIESDAHDLTRGMTGKLDVAMGLAADGIASCVVNGRVPEAVAGALAGDPAAGTWVPAAG